jgi:hypothetical protein
MGFERSRWRGASVRISLLHERRVTIVHGFREGVRVGDGAPRVFTDVRGTELPALRGLLRAAARAHYACITASSDAAAATAAAASPSPRLPPLAKTGALVLDAAEARRTAEAGDGAPAPTTAPTAASGAAASAAESAAAASRKRKDPPPGQSQPACSALSTAHPPKAGPTGFMLFCKMERPNVTAAHPAMTFGTLGSELGRRWNALSAAQQAAWKQGRPPPPQATAPPPAPAPPAAPTADDADAEIIDLT